MSTTHTPAATQVGALRIAPWKKTIAFGLLVIATTLVLPHSGVRSGLELAMLAFPVVVIPLGMRRNGALSCKAWWALWAGFACFAIGWMVLQANPLAEGHALIPAIPHVPAVPLVALAVYLVLRGRGTPLDIDSLLDAVIVCTAAAFVASRALLQPAFTGTDLPRQTLALVSIYPLLDLLLLVALLHLTFTSSKPSISWRLLLIGTSICLVGDVMLAMATAHGHLPGLSRNVTAVGYLLIGTAAIDPSMGELTLPVPSTAGRLGPVRICLLGISLLTTPFVIMLDEAQAVHRASTSLLLPSGVLSVIILARMVDLAREAERNRQRVRERERRFESLVRHSSDLVAIIGLDEQLTYVSPAVETILGVDQHAAVSRTLRDWVHPEDGSAAGAALLKLTRGGDTTRLTLRLRHANDTWRWMDVHAINLLHEPTIAGVVVNCHDITQRHVAEQIVLASNVQQAAVAELGRDALAGGTVQQLAERTAALVRETLSVASCVLYFVDDAGGVELTAGEGLPLPEPGPIGQLRAHPLLRACLTTDELVHVALDSLEAPLPDPATAAHIALLPANVSQTRAPHPSSVPAAGDATALAVRVSDGHRPFGILLVRADDARRFRVDEASFLHSMASTLGLAIARREVEHDARHQALHDELTGLPNRALFVDRLNRALHRLEDGGNLLAVFFLDVDHFKVVNDSLGHGAGDRILVSVTERLQRLLRPDDTIARFGGDEFTVLCEDLASIDAAFDVAQRIREELAAALQVGRAEIHTTVSIGIAVADQPGMSTETLLRDADAAMYRAKERGRNRVELFDDTMRSRAVTRLRTEMALREALSLDQLVLHYQPIVDLESGQFLAAEALVRWNHPTDGLVLPGRFIPVAEEAGIIHDLGRWVLTEAVAQVSRWHAQYGPLTPVLGVNVSARSLARGDFVADVAAILQHADVPPNFVCLEITESALMDDVDHSLGVLSRLRTLGVTLAIDDFGTGYSSLSYLKRFPIDVLKIDRSFIDGLGREAEDSAIVATVVNLATTLDRISIAEGVETPLHLRELQRLDCTLGQGFLFSKAVPAEQLDVLAGFDVRQTRAGDIGASAGPAL